MGRSNGEDKRVRSGRSGVEQDVSKAARNAALIGRIADLRVGSEQLFLQTTEQTRMALCISDPRKRDCPIVYSNAAFSDLTGYAREEIVGRNCRFLQGRGTRPAAVAKIREAIETERYTVVDILNYRKDGSAFWNAVHIGPIYDEHGELAYFFGSQWDITELLAAREALIENERIAAELRHRTDNLFAVLSAIVRLSARGASDVDELSEKISRRIEALAGAHRVSLSSDDLQDDATDLGQLVAEVMKPYRTAQIDRIEVIGDRVSLPRKHVTPIGLTLHELATNALKYGSLASPAGKVHIDWEIEGETIVLHWIESGADKDDAQDAAYDATANGNGTGSRLIEGTLRGIRGEIETRFAEDGFRATIKIPAKQHSMV